MEKRVTEASSASWQATFAVSVQCGTAMAACMGSWVLLHLLIVDSGLIRDVCMHAPGCCAHSDSASVCRRSVHSC